MTLRRNNRIKDIFNFGVIIEKSILQPANSVCALMAQHYHPMSVDDKNFWYYTIS